MKTAYILVCTSLLLSIATSALADDMSCGGKVTQAALAKVTTFVPTSVSTDQELLDYLKAANKLCDGGANSYWAKAVLQCQQNYSPMGATQTTGCATPAMTLHDLKP